MVEGALICEGIVAGYVPDLPILRDVAMRVESGSITVIIGPNGAGKSTLIKAIAGLVPVSAGRIVHQGVDISHTRPDQLAKHGIAYVPQMDNVFRTLTIQQNLDLALRNAKSGSATRRQELYALFPALAEKRNDKAGGLSGGQRQFLAIAMALATNPRFLILDEPSAGLAPKAAQEVLVRLKALAGEGMTILLVEQNVKQALKIADYCYILAEGQNQVDGPASELLADPVVGEIYLGAKRVRKQ
ncbi:MAG: ABC transporter ATP-binding protein [Pseudomonadota bacterium]